MREFDWFAQLTEDDTDPATPAFWETVHALAKQGKDLRRPDIDLPHPSLAVMRLELQRSVALKTPTMALEVIGNARPVDDGSGDGSAEPGPESPEQPV